tara:strand:- start:1833 stop:2090 length:258 start_codon:yes stop_codon:yes gene_type:complete
VNAAVAVVVRMNETIKGFFRRTGKFYNGVIVALLFVCVFVWACNDIYFGKSQREIEEELMRSIFEVDSLIMDIKITLGDSSIIHR